MAKRRGNGEGSITYRKKDKRWQGSCTVGYDENGKPRRRYFYGKSRDEVKEKIDEAIKVVNATGSYEEKRNMIVAEWLNEWLYNYKKHSLRPTTWESYEMNVKKHINPVIGGIKLAKLTTSDIQRLYNIKLSPGGRADKKEGALSLRSVKYIHTILKQALEQARKQHLILHNPAEATVIRREEDKKDIKFLDTEGVKKLLGRVKDSKHYPAYLLELATGLRRGELLGLRWKDVDLENGTVSVNQNLVRTKEKGLIFQPPKTKYGKRTIEIPENVVKELKKHKAKQNEYKMLLGDAYQKHDLVFCKEDGSPYCPRTFARQFEIFAEKAGLQGITFHCLRHTFATLSLQEGIDIRTTQENLGHHDSAFTINVYSNATKKMKKEATNKIGNLLASCTK